MGTFPLTAEQLATDTVAQIVALAKERPGIVILLNAGNSLGFISHQTRPLLDATLRKLISLGKEYHPLHFPLNEVHEYVPKLMELLETNNLTYTATFFQPLRTGPGQAVEWHQCMARLIAQDNAERPQIISCFVAPIDPKTQETAKLQRRLDEAVFLQRHAAVYGGLSRREREVLPYMALGFSYAGTASALQTNAHAATTFYYCIRAKMRLCTSTFELEQYARALNLI